MVMTLAKFLARSGYSAVFILVFGVASRVAYGAEDKALESGALALNDVTGEEPMNGQVGARIADEEGAKKLFAVASRLAKEKDQPFNFNAAFILARAATQLKDYGAGQVFYRVCLDQASMLRSREKIVQSLTGLSTIIDLLYYEKKYEETAKLSQEFLEILEKQGFPEEIKGDVLRQWIRALIKQGKSDDASKMIDNLVKARGDNWRNQELRAWFHQENKRMDEATQAYEAALQLIEKD